MTITKIEGDRKMGMTINFDIKIPRVFTIGDIHGRIEALKEVLAKAHFNYETDTLISLGDIVDGGYNTYEVVEELLKIKHLVVCRGNHDTWYMDHISSGWSGEIWLSQGGRNTIESYRRKDKLIPVTHQDLFNKMVPYYKYDNMLFVHGGFDARHGKNVEDADIEFLTWDRDLIEYAREGNTIPGYDTVFVGHTTTQGYSWDIEPIRFKNLIMLDVGAGWTGKLCLMDIHSKEYWLSEVQEPAR